MTPEMHSPCKGDKDCVQKGIIFVLSIGTIFFSPRVDWLYISIIDFESNHRSDTYRKYFAINKFCSTLISGSGSRWNPLHAVTNGMPL